MGLIFEGPADEVKVHLDTVVGTATDLLTNLASFMIGLGYTGAVEDRIRAWLISETSASTLLATNDILRIYLDDLGYTQSSLEDAVRAAAIAGNLFGPSEGYIFDELSENITDESGEEIW